MECSPRHTSLHITCGSLQNELIVLFIRLASSWQRRDSGRRIESRQASEHLNPSRAKRIQKQMPAQVAHSAFRRRIRGNGAATCPLPAPPRAFGSTTRIPVSHYTRQAPDAGTLDQLHFRRHCHPDMLPCNIFSPSTRRLWPSGASEPPGPCASLKVPSRPVFLHHTDVGPHDSVSYCGPHPRQI